MRLPALPTAPARLALSLIALAGAACGGGGGSVPTSDLRLFLTGTVHGYLEPCGCVAGRIGGVDRIASYVRRERAAHPSTLLLDAGDLFHDVTELKPLEREQLELKARAFFEVWSDLGCEGMAVGENDLVIGVEALRGLSEEFDVPLLSANLYDGDGERVFEPYTVVERGGLRVGVFSLLGTRLTEAEVDSTRTISVRAQVKDMGLRLRPPAEEVDELLAELDERSDVIVFLSHTGYAANRKFARSQDAIDFVYGPHFDDSKGDLYFVDGTPLAVAAIRGARVGVADFWWEDREAFLASQARPRYANESRRMQALHEMEAFRTGLALLEGREPVLGSAEYEKDRVQNLTYYDRTAEMLAELPPFPERDAFAYRAVPMHVGLGRDETALRTLDRYHDGLSDLWLTPDAPPSRHPTPLFVGPQQCVDCHPAQYEFWKATRHSRAIAKLEATNQHLDVQCIGCHSVGFRMRRGFLHPASQEGFVNVQCAACHGPEGPHVQGGASYVDPTLWELPTQNCARCHNKEHDPEFQADGPQKLMRVTCPPTVFPDGATPALREALVEAGEELQGLPQPPWPLVLDSLAKAGATERRLAAAERYATEQPRSNDARIELALAAVDAGRAESVLPLLETATVEAPLDPRGWAGLSAVLRSSDPDRALLAALEAYSLEPTAEHVRVVAEAQLATGDRAGAIDSVRAHLTNRPGDLYLLEAYWEELQGF